MSYSLFNEVKDPSTRALLRGDQMVKIINSHRYDGQKVTPTGLATVIGYMADIPEAERAEAYYYVAAYFEAKKNG